MKRMSIEIIAIQADDFNAIGEFLTEIAVPIPNSNIDGTSD